MEHSRRHSERLKVEAGHVCIGCIIWLPAKGELNGEITCCCGGCSIPEKLEEAGYDHPVMIVNIHQRKGSSTIGDLVCDVVCITTFSGTTIEKYEVQRFRLPYLKRSLSIHHSNSEPPQDSHMKQLRLEKGKLRKQSYVRLKHVFRVDIGKLHTYKWRKSPAYKWRLSKESFDDLVHELDLPKPIYIETDVVVRTSKTRMQALARTQTPRTQTPRTPPPANSDPTISGERVLYTSRRERYDPPNQQYDHSSFFNATSTPASQEHDRYSIPVVPGSYQHYFNHQARTSVHNNQTHSQVGCDYGSISASHPPVTEQRSNTALRLPQYEGHTYPTEEEEDGTSWLGVGLGLAAALTMIWIWRKF
ncbi:hypothetical protein BJ875DRAFT_547272 [Amylocarpus encephaloides]|uniref:Uncharacterized protein n=1 Tax=Amylocarpus encephaloides TaxID=45428 RepID=A0A9P8C061_9HELO|nr:hypothetical protein BJ875DRAFT_547272 [Amylocarpus encephaloides]